MNPEITIKITTGETSVSGSAPVPTALGTAQVSPMMQLASPPVPLSYSGARATNTQDLPIPKPLDQLGGGTKTSVPPQPQQSSLSSMTYISPSPLPAELEALRNAAEPKPKTARASRGNRKRK